MLSDYQNGTGWTYVEDMKNHLEFLFTNRELIFAANPVVESRYRISLTLFVNLLPHPCHGSVILSLITGLFSVCTVDSTHTIN